MAQTIMGLARARRLPRWVLGVLEEEFWRGGEHQGAVLFVEHADQISLTAAPPAGLVLVVQQESDGGHGRGQGQGRRHRCSRARR